MVVSRTKTKEWDNRKHNRKHDYRVEMNGNLYLYHSVWHFLNLIPYVVKYI